MRLPLVLAAIVAFPLTACGAGGDTDPAAFDVPLAAQGKGAGSGGVIDPPGPPSVVPGLGRLDAFADFTGLTTKAQILAELNKAVADAQVRATAKDPSAVVIPEWMLDAVSVPIAGAAKRYVFVLVCSTHQENRYYPGVSTWEFVVTDFTGLPDVDTINDDFVTVAVLESSPKKVKRHSHIVLEGMGSIAFKIDLLTDGPAHAAAP